ncbi:MAG: HD domain-containing protein [Lachnospiraceae bacterium]|nr:HD domain-containing protein [Lachnospiraceae bacterium]
MNAREYLEILHVAERLKDTPRHCTTTKGRTESVAEHSWRISLMAFLLRHEFPEADMDRVVSMGLIHDLGECFTGDIPTFIKTDSDRKTEDILLEQWVASLPDEVSNEFEKLYSEMEAFETVESKIYKALDKLEALIQHNESPLSTWSENEYELNKTYAFNTVEFSEWLMELRKEILKDTLYKIDETKWETIYLSEFSDVFYVKDKNVVLVRWKKYCELEQYREPLEHALEVIGRHPGCNYVADTRSGFEDNPLDTKWVAEFFMPKAKENGCQIIYFIIDEDNSLREELEGQEKDSSNLLEFRYICSLDEV